MVRQPTEAQLQRQIIEAAGYLGYRAFHPRVMVGSAAGFPDLTLAKPGRLIFVEVKGPRGRVSHAQQEWIDLLATVPGVAAMIVFPDDWEAMERVLTSDGGAPGGHP